MIGGGTGCSLGSDAHCREADGGVLTPAARLHHHFSAVYWGTAQAATLQLAHPGG